MVYVMDAEKQKHREGAFRKLEELSAFGNQVSAELLLECLAQPYGFIRSEAVSRVRDYGRKDFTLIFGMALNDKFEFVVQDAAQALANISTDEALEILSNAFFEGEIERPHHIANAISQFGERGFDVLLRGTKSSSPNIRYYSARFLGSTKFESAIPILEDIANKDNEKTSFTALVSSGARKGLKTLLKNLENKT
jgi:HEAT repeat protein